LGKNFSGAGQEGSAMPGFEELLDQANARLKAAHIGVRIRQRGGRLP
jgi:hypothetical protein